MTHRTPIEVLQALAEARALIWRTCEFDLHDAVAPLIEFARTKQIPDTIAADIINAAIDRARREKAWHEMWATPFDFSHEPKA